MAKQVLYYILKITTSRLAQEKFNITDFTTSKARANGELIFVGDNQVFNFLRELTGRTTDVLKLTMLYENRNAIKKLPSSEENFTACLQIQSLIDEMLFVSDIVNVKVDSKKIYKKICKEGFVVNGIRYVRLCTGAGQSRRNTSTFVNVNLYDRLNTILMNGLNLKEINIAKFNAYYGLYMSSIQRVTTPRVCLINDCEVTLLNKKVDWVVDKEGVDENGNKTEYREIEERITDLNMNPFDGQGLISPMFAKFWTNDLQLDFTPCQFIIRSSFIKGMLATFDFHRFARDIVKTEKITDVYGCEWDINEIDIILSVSQFKMWKQYKSWQDYLDNCNKFGHIWGITKWNKRSDSKMSLLNYQYAQTLDLTHEDIKTLAQPTIEWIDKICSGDKLFSLLFLLGVSDIDADFDEILDKSENYIVKAIAYNDKFLKDPFIQSKIYDIIKTKIKEAKIGRLWVRGNYQIMISDPFAQCEFAFGLPVCGLLGDNQYFSQYWNKQKIKTVDACRSPLVDFHEHNIINFVKMDTLSEWYGELYTGIIYNVWGVDTIRHSDSDWDGDIIFTTDNETVINGVIPELNAISYDKATSPLQRLNMTNIINSDNRTFDSKVGKITNFSTIFISMLSKFKKDSPEYAELLNRIKLLRRYIGDSIDMAKGIKMKPFPKSWKKFLKIEEGDTEEVKQGKYYHNSLVGYKKPYFMIHIYEHLMREYVGYKKMVAKQCVYDRGCKLDVLINKDNKTDDDKKFLRQYYNRMPVLKSRCVINELCWIIDEIDSKFKFTKAVINKEDEEAIVNIMTDKTIAFDKEKFNKVSDIYKEYEKTRKSILKHYMDSRLIPTELKNFPLEDLSDCLSVLIEEYKSKSLSICSNPKEFANYCVELCYVKHPSHNKNFVWQIAKEGVLLNVKQNSTDRVEFPVFDINGVSYLGGTYKLAIIGDETNVDI